MTSLAKLLPPLLAIVLAPLMIGVINRVKAKFAGRVGPPLLQPYYDLRKLLAKGAVYSRTTTWMFRAGPIITLAAALAALTLMPLGGIPAIFAFRGDLVLFAYLLALGRFFTICAALDTGSPFEGMGASREAFFSSLSEPTLLLGLAAIARQVIPGEVKWFSITNLHLHLTGSVWLQSGLILMFVGAALVIVLLTESSRIPVDDPTTHLELTMIHEVMVLDHGGVDFAYIEYAAALKMWLIGALLVNLMIPVSGNAVLDLALPLAGLFMVAVLVGFIESIMARLRMLRVPQLLVGAASLAVLALILEYRAG